jgi:uncharacterized protein
MNRRLIWILMLVAAVSLLAGLWRFRIDVDVFNLLPTESRMVEGLQLYQRSFGSSRELVISLRSEEAKLTERAARSLAESLERSDLATKAIWRSPFRDDPGQLGEFLAYTWFNQPPEVFEGLAQRLREEQLRPTLEGTLERMATSLRPQEVARLSYDPFGLTDLADRIASPMGQQMQDPFASADGSFRILFVPLPFESAGFLKVRRWVEGVTNLVDAWKQKEAFDGELTVRLTGTPAFVSRTGSGLMRDVVSSALGTLVLVAGLFWLVYRNWLPLAWLVVLLVLVLMVSASLGAVLLGTLNAASLGFAAILMGLAADYGVLLYQEFVAHPKRSVAEHRSAVAPSILWAAVTTSGAFFLITRSSLPGLTQLGTLVGIGILVAAVIMLLAFLPPLAGKVHPGRSLAQQAGGRLSALGFRFSPLAAWSLTFLAAAASVSVLSYRLPAVDFSTKNLGPKDNPSMEALEEIQREIGGFDDALWLIVDGADEGEVARRLEAVKAILDASVKEGVLAGYRLPVALWPRPDAQQENRETASWLASRLPEARDAALTEGFTDSSLQLTDQAFAAWGRFAAREGVVWPSNPASQWVFRQFAGQDAGRLLVLGQLEASEAVTQAGLRHLTATIADATGARLFSWSMLTESLLKILKHDAKKVLLPMAVLLLLLLGIAFRSFAGVALSLATLGFSLLCLMGVMALLGWSWNLMNVMALPLLFGAGVDYSIHIQFALERHRGDASEVRKTVGRAVLLCGATTAAGFGTLAFASNAGLAGLGRVCATGLFLTNLISVYLLPAWWRTLRGARYSESSPGES